MLYNLYINQKMAEKENLSGNALVLFDTFRQLMALPYIEQVVIDNERYTVLYRNMLIKQVPYFIKSTRTLSRAIKELLDAELVRSNSNDNYPAYIFTNKALSYMTSSSSNELAQNIQTDKKPRRKPLLSLPKKVRFEDLKEEYIKVLQSRAKDMSQKHKVPFSEFELFIEHHVKNGNKFANWLSAYSTWCRNYKKFHAKDGENGSRGMYA